MQIETDLRHAPTSPLRRLHIVVVALCMSVTLFDGFDLQVISFVAPAIARELSIQKELLGLIFSAGVAGMLIGMLGQGPLSDRFGRRPLILTSVTLFAVATMACAAARTTDAFIALRLLGGIGMGAVIPNIFALCIEIAPIRLRSRMIVMLGIGVPIGGLIAGMLSSWLLPFATWHWLFVIGSVMPLSIVPIAWACLPESPMFLIERAGRNTGARAADDLARVDCLIARGWVRPARSDIQVERRGMAALFGADLRRSTLLLWTITACNMVIFYSLLSWLPLIQTAQGTPENLAALGGVMLNLGSLTGSLPIAWAADRFNTARVLAAVLLAGIGIFIVTGLVLGGSLALFLLMCALCGTVAGGGNLVLNAVVGQVYPTAVRATGIGFAGMAGRVGAIIGPALCGFLLAAGMTGGSLIALFAVPAAIAATACLKLRLQKAAGPAAADSD